MMQLQQGGNMKLTFRKVIATLRLGKCACEGLTRLIAATTCSSNCLSRCTSRVERGTGYYTTDPTTIPILVGDARPCQ